MGLAREDFWVEVGKGIYPKLSTMLKFGRNVNVTSTASDVWDARTVSTTPNIATLITVVSGSADDNAATTGADTMLIQGLDTNFEEQEETVSLLGIGTVTSANSYTRVHRMAITSAGSQGKNVGTITATYQGTGTAAMIEPNNNQTLMALYTVPSNKKALLTSWYLNSDRSSGAASTIDGALLIKPFGEVFQTKSHLGLNRDGTGYIDKKYLPYMQIDSKSDIKISAFASVITSDVHAGFDLLLYKA